MYNLPIKPWRRRIRIAAAALGLAMLTGGVACAADETGHNAQFDKDVMATLKQCRDISPSCADTTQNAVGILVFPHVLKADLIVGGAGGKGALIENGQIVGYYNIGAGSVGLQAGIDNASQVYVFRTQEALNKLTEGQDWKVGADAGVTLVTANANAAGTTGDVLAYVFQSAGLNAGVALDVFDVWKSGQQRPS